MQYFSMIHYRQSLLETDILVSNLKKRRALSSTSISLNKIRNMNIVFLIFLIRIKQYNTSKIRIIQTRIIRSSTIIITAIQRPRYIFFSLLHLFKYSTIIILRESFKSRYKAV